MGENFMKKLILLGLSLCLLLHPFKLLSKKIQIKTNEQTFNEPTFSDFHKKGLAFRVSSQSIGLEYYTNNHNWAFGCNLKPLFLNIRFPNIIWGHSLGLSCRKNFPLKERATWGIGLSSNFGVGGVLLINETYDNLFYIYGSFIDFGPYFSLEYAANKNALFSCEIEPYRLTGIVGRSGRTRFHSFFPTISFKFSYLFAL